MNAQQFDIIAQLLSLRGGASQEAARLHLIDGVAVAEAAARVGVTYQAASQAVKRVLAGFALVQACHAAGLPDA